MEKEEWERRLKKGNLVYRLFNKKRRIVIEKGQPPELPYPQYVVFQIHYYTTGGNGVQIKCKELQELKRRIEYLEEQKERVRAQMESSTAILKDMPKGSTLKDKIAEGIVKLFEIQEELNNKVVQYNITARNMEAKISELENPGERMVMRLRYIDGLDWQSIAVVLSYSVDHCFTLHRKAMLTVNNS